METQQIPTNEWPTFLDNFSRQHEGWLVNLEVFGPELGNQVEETGLALEGITGEWAGSQGKRITIMAGGKPNDHVTHSISSPTEVSLEKTDEGADVALAIKSADGMTSLLRFRGRVLPELIDTLTP